MLYVRHYRLLWIVIISIQLFTTYTYAKGHLNIQVIEASKANEYVDPALKPLKHKLFNSFKKVNYFKQLDTLKIPLQKKANKNIKLTKDLSATILINKVLANKFKFSLKIPKKNRRLKINAKRKKLFFQAMKWKGKVYILAFKTTH